MLESVRFKDVSASVSKRNRVKISWNLIFFFFVITNTDSFRTDVRLARTTETERVHTNSRPKNSLAAVWLAIAVTWLIPVLNADLLYHGLALAGFDARLQYSSIRDLASARLSVGLNVTFSQWLQRADTSAFMIFKGLLVPL